MPTGVATTYDLTVGVQVAMDEAIYMLSFQDTPLLTGLGADGLPVLPSRPVDQREFAWMDDTLLTPRSTLAAQVTTGDTVITVASGDRTKFSTGDAVTFQKAGSTDDEVVRITGYGTTANTLLIDRTNLVAGSATTYATSVVVMSLGTALAEGSDPEAARTVDRVENTNVTQIFGPTAIHLSRTEQQVGKYGVNNEFTHQTMGRMKENAQMREQAFLYGRKYSSTTTKIRTTGGLSHYLTTNVDNTNTQLTVANIQSSNQNVWNQGGDVDLLIANPASLTDLNDLSNTTVVVVEARDAMRGRRRVMTVETEFGTMTVVRDRFCLKTDAFGVSRERVIRRVLQPLILERLAKTGDSDKAQIVAEEGLEVRGEEHGFRLTNLTAY